VAIDRLTLTQFRNHAATRLDGTGKINLLFGENGAGKTNVLEAISLLAPGRGLRRAALIDIPRSTSGEGFGVSAMINCADGREPVQIGTGSEAQRPGRRVVHVNGASTPANALGEWLGLSWLTPAMDRLFTDSAGARRRYLDRLALALDPAHAGQAARYDNALRERNRLLSDDTEPDPDWLEAIEAQLAECGSALSRTRAALVEALDTALDRLPDQPFARPTLTYQAGGPLARDGLADALRASRRQDRAARRTLTGPHRDELEVRMASKAMPASECSTGEQKAMLIAITLAHAELAAGERPRILLLDEVAAHLDPLRREALFERLLAGKAQVWMTGTERAPFAAIGTQAAVWKIAQGEALRAS